MRVRVDWTERPVKKANCPVMKRSSTKLVSSVLESSIRGLGASASFRQIVESLILVFVASRSLRKEWFSTKELGRFRNSMRITAQRIHEHVTVDSREQAYCKYWLDKILFQCFRSSLSFPECDAENTTPLFSGWCKRCIQRHVARRDVSFCYSLQKGAKQAWPELSEEKKDQSLQKHKLRLSVRKDKCSTRLAAKIATVSESIFNTQHELFGKTVNSSSLWSLYKKFMPSGSACLQASRRNGGALGLFGKFQFPRTHSVPGALVELTRGVNVWRQSNYLKAVDSVRDRIFDGDDGTSPVLSVDIVAIPEPGKFRIISKGDGFLYQALQPL